MNKMFANVITLSPRRAWADWAGLIASIGCAVHCAVMPLVLAYLPSFGLSWLADEMFHRWMAVLCFGLAAAAFIPGWQKHRSFVPGIWGAAGLLLLTTAAFGSEESCCVSCTPNDATISTALDVECAFCESSEAIVPTTAGGFSPISLSSFATPLGGLLLVVGHIVNHSLSCKLQADSCCLTDNESMHRPVRL